MERAKGFYVALLTLAGLAQETREPGLMKVDIESLRVQGFNASIGEVRGLRGSKEWSVKN